MGRGRLIAGQLVHVCGSARSLRVRSEIVTAAVLHGRHESGDAVEIELVRTCSAAGPGTMSAGASAFPVAGR
jgi:hypothetical protein